MLDGVSPGAPPLTEEQRRAVALAARGRDAAIVARAGSGKTHTLRAAALAKEGVPQILLAFNRAIAREAAERFPAHVRCTTLHAVAFRAVVGRDPRMRRKFEALERWTPHDELAAAGLDPRDPGRFAHLAAIRATVRGYCASDDPELCEAHVPAPFAARWHADLGAQRARERLRWTARRAARAWARVRDPHDPVPIDHDGYLKTFALMGGHLDAEGLLVDEAQDLAPVMLGLVRAQDAPRLLVGDPAQRIYGWRGAVDAMAASGYPEVRLTRSFRFGPEIADAARRALRVLTPGAALVGAGSPGVVADAPEHAPAPPTDRPRAVLCRSNVGVLDAVLTLGEHGVHVVGGLGSTVAAWERAHRLWRDRDAAAGAGLGRGSGALRTGSARSATGDGGGDLPAAGELAGIDRWDTLVQVAELQGGALATLRRLTERHEEDVPRLCRALRRAERDRESEAPIVVSTIHRAKGREWDDVELWRDLPRVPASAEALIRSPDPESARAETNLLYVAATRARRVLRLGRLRDDLKELLRPNGER